MPERDSLTQFLVRVGCSRTNAPTQRRGISCRTFRGRDASRRVALMGRREVQIEADGGKASLIAAGRIPL